MTTYEEHHVLGQWFREDGVYGGGSVSVVLSWYLGRQCLKQIHTDGNDIAEWSHVPSMNLGIAVKVSLALPELGPQEHLRLCPRSSQLTAEEEIMGIRTFLMVVPGNRLLDPQHVVCREMEVSHHAIFAGLHQRVDPRVVCEELFDGDFLIWESVGNPRDIVRLGAFEVDYGRLNVCVHIFVCYRCILAGRRRHL